MLSVWVRSLKVTRSFRSGLAPGIGERNSMLSSVGTGDLLVGVPARLDVAGELDRLPTEGVAVAAVLGGGVRALAGVLVEERFELGGGVESAVLIGRRQRDEVVAERIDAAPVLLLPARDRPVELALGHAAGAFDPGPPGQLLERRERQELPEGRLAARPAREWPAGPDPGRV